MNSPVTIPTHAIESSPGSRDNNLPDKILSCYPGAFKPISKQDATAILGVSLRTVENWINQGILPSPANLGGRRMWHPDIFFLALDTRLRATTGNQQSTNVDAVSVTNPSRQQPRHPENLPAAARARERAAARIETMRARLRGAGELY